MRTAQKNECPGGAGQVAKQIDQEALILARREEEEKTFATLRAKYAMRGHALHRTHQADGPQAFYVKRWGMVRPLPTLEHARAFPVQIGGAL